MGAEADTQKAVWCGGFLDVLETADANESLRKKAMLGDEPLETVESP